MNIAVYEHLIEVARNGKTTTYGDVAAIAGVPARRIAGVLEEIAEGELAAGRPAIIAVILRGDTFMPGKGLFQWAKRRGLQDDHESDTEFFVEELRRVHDYWRKATPGLNVQPGD